MRITKLFTCVVAALTLLYSSGCCEQNVVVPNPCDPCQTGVTYAPVVVKPRKVKQRKVRRQTRRNTRFVQVSPYCQYPVQHGHLLSDPCLTGYTIDYTYPGYGTATLLTDPNVVPSVMTASVTVAPAPVSQVAGTQNCRTVYRKGRRPGKIKTARPVGYVPYTTPVYTTSATVSEPYTLPADQVGTAYLEPTPITPVYTEPLPFVSYVEPVVDNERTYIVTSVPETVPAAEPAPAESPKKDPELSAAPEPKPISESASAGAAKEEEPPAAPKEVFEPVAAKTPPPAPAPVVEQQPIVQRIVIQPIIQPVVQPSAPVAQAPMQPIVERAPLPAPAPAPAYRAPAAMPLPPYDPVPAVQQGPIVSEPLPGMVSVNSTGASGFEPGILSSYCPPEICPAPSPVLCQPGQNLSDCFTMNEYQIQNTPTQIYTPRADGPLSIAVPPAPVAAPAVSTPPVAVPPRTAVQTPVPAAPPVVTNAGSKYEALTPPQDISGRGEARRPEVSMPTPIGGGNGSDRMPPVPATREIESALDAMLSQPTLK